MLQFPDQYPNFSELQSPELIEFLLGDFQLVEKVEHEVTRIRAGILRDGASLELLSAMAIDCFAKEYILSETKNEQDILAHLSLYDGPKSVAMLACYRPLMSFHEPTWLLETEAPNDIYRRLLSTQIVEPLEERRLRGEIPSIGAISDQVSLTVRSMYEENPLPRWTLRPKSALRHDARVAMLVAGCGSGHQPIQLALEYPNSTIVALDLSMASLAYGLRKAREFGIKNIEFIHGDILNVAELNRHFDFISCVGVLHHMADPYAGLTALREVLTKDGYIELGLYSKHGRQANNHAIALRTRLGLGPTPSDIRQFRESIFGLPPQHPAREITRFAEFYSIAGCRDLAFHPHEHLLTLPELSQLISKAGFRLKRFCPPEKAIAKFKHELPAGDLNSLEHWHGFELSHPNTFRSMYRLVVEKD